MVQDKIMRYGVIVPQQIFAIFEKLVSSTP